MTRKTWAPALAMMALVGCTLTPSASRREPFLPRPGVGGQLLAPKHCTLRVMIPSRPVPDAVLDDVLWGVADEQVVAPEVRRALESNGLRVGLIAGDLPAEVQALLEAPPPHRVDPLLIDLPDGDSTLIALGAAATPPSVSVLLNREGKAVGKVYEQAKGHLRLTATQDRSGGVALRLVPEIHHGPFRRRIGTEADADAFAPQQFSLKDGQEEETLRELAASLTVQPGQVLVVGCRSGLPHSLGHFLMTEPEPHSDRLLEKVLLVWAGRSTAPAVPGAGPVDPPGDLEPVEPPDSLGQPADREPTRDR
ncbi:MAG TPA: hypothetical protein VF590_00885 [Isosphaeraceae bacterium]|jgi:hypothetical protein